MVQEHSFWPSFFIKSRGEKMNVTILATSDMHGYIMPTNFSEKEMTLPFGTAKVATVLDQLKRQAKGPVIQIENGDFIQGSPLSYFIRKNESIGVQALTAVPNQLGYDVGVVGNHEFNYGQEYLKEAITSYNYPVLAANVVDDDGQHVLGDPYVIIEKEGVKIAILGVVTQYIPKWEQPATIKGLHFLSLVETAQKYVPILREQADVVIVSYHGGFERDLETGKPTELLTGENEGYELLQHVPGIDALVTGHQHRELAGKLNGVPYIQPGYRGAFVGKIELTVEEAADGYKVTDSQAVIVATGEEEPAKEIVSLIADVSNETEQWLDQTLGTVNGDMTIQDPNQARLIEHPYVEFINRVQMEASGAPISATALFNNEGKGFRSTITMRDVITNYIYPNTLAVLKLSGKELKAALEKTADFFVLQDGNIVFNPIYIEPKPQYYNYDMYEGIDYTIDFTKPSGQRIVRLQYQGKDLADNQEVEVVTNQYRAVGGGNYDMFGPEKIVREVQIDMTELIAEYLRKNPVIEAKANQNFQVLPK